jgi:hypothetical protein
MFFLWKLGAVFAMKYLFRTVETARSGLDGRFMVLLVCNILQVIVLCSFLII